MNVKETATRHHGTARPFSTATQARALSTFSLSLTNTKGTPAEVTASLLQTASDRRSHHTQARYLTRAHMHVDLCSHLSSQRTYMLGRGT